MQTCSLRHVASTSTNDVSYVTYRTCKGKSEQVETREKREEVSDRIKCNRVKNCGSSSVDNIDNHLRLNDSMGVTF